MRRRDVLRQGALAAITLVLPWARALTAGSVEDELWADAARGRTLPLRLRWPQGEQPCAAVLFSHGLGGSKEGGALWGEAWAAAGFLVLHLQHPGSDAAIWQGGMSAVRQGSQIEQYLARVRDVRFVLDEMGRRQAVGGRWGRVRLDAIGISGHSFGARTVQALAGEVPLAAGDEALAALRDPRPRAFIAFSPGFSARGGVRPEEAARRFGAIARPFLCITGTRDGAVLAGDASNETRLAVYEGLPPGQKAQLVLDGADHYTFAGQVLRLRPDGLLQRAPGALAREASHHALVAQISADWWRWRLLDDAQARERLREPTGLAPGDRWAQG